VADLSFLVNLFSFSWSCSHAFGMKDASLARREICFPRLIKFSSQGTGEEDMDMIEVEASLGQFRGVSVSPVASLLVSSGSRSSDEKI